MSYHSDLEENLSQIGTILEAAADNLAALPDDDVMNVETLKDTLYDLTADAESAAGAANYLLHADVGELRDRVYELEATLDSLAQALRDLHGEL